MNLMVAKRRFLYLFLTLGLLPHCKDTKREERNIVQEIQQAGTLVTAEYTLQKMVKAADNRTWYKFGDRKILMSVQAVVKAGIDLQHLRPADAIVRDSTLDLRLPAPTIFSVSLPPDKITVQYEQVNFFRSRFSATEREALLQQAESQVRQLADSLGILETARTNAMAFFQRLFKRDFKSVNVQFDK